jgi:hypothetical protein
MDDGDVRDLLKGTPGEERLSRDDFFLTIERAAEYAGHTVAEIQQLMDDGELGFIHVKPEEGSIRIPRPALERHRALKLGS